VLLEDAQPSAFGLGVQCGHGPGQRQDWRLVDGDGSGRGASTRPGPLPAATTSRPRHLELTWPVAPQNAVNQL
jgi:hypothetical protein